MIFLFEQLAYKRKYLESVLPQKDNNWDLPKGFVSKVDSDTYRLDGVGYLYNPACKKLDCSDKIVFVLPKVFASDNQRAFGAEVKADVDFTLGEDMPQSFLSNLSLWVCSSIAQYRLENPDDFEMQAPDARDFSEGDCPTLIDVKNAMERFYAENKNLFVFVSKNKHSGNNHVDWRRTVARTQPFMQGDTPIYMQLENKKKVFDLDDRLIVLYFSAMNYIAETFGFKMPTSEFYAPMRVNEFRRLLGHRGLMELRRIKYKYFADKFLRLYNIMKAFFTWGARFRAGGFNSEYLLTSKYNNVFEAMIDKLVGDDVPEVDSLKHNDDGKIIDHLYKENSLIFSSGETDKIWHIGDSKYYSDPADIRGTSIAKQFTYAKNIIQNFFGPEYVDGKEMHASDIHQGVRYRDELTEGYSVTPNFFVRGELPEYKDKEQFKEPYFRQSSESAENLIQEVDEDAVFDDGNGNKRANVHEYLWKHRNRQFQNRLFDRDTLLLQVYNVNFLYVLKAYTAKSSSLREEFKKVAREKFRENFLKLLNKKYYFWAVYLKDADSCKDWKQYEETLEKIVNENFKIFTGRIFRSEDVKKWLILALEKDSVEQSRDDYLAIKKVIDENCEISRLDSFAIWDDSKIYEHSGWGELP